MSSEKTSVRIASSQHGVDIILEAIWMGDDMSISIYGGDKPHIGAVALAQARPGHDDPERVSASTSVITVCGHKEDRLACLVAERVAMHINGVVSVSCGIHVERASSVLIEDILIMTEKLVNQLLGQVSQG